MPVTTVLQWYPNQGTRKHRIVQRLGCLFGRGSLGRGNVAEHQLGQLIGLAVPPNLHDVCDTLVDLCAGFVRQRLIDNARVQAQLAAIRCDFEHIVLGGVHRAAVYQGGTLGERLHHFLLLLGRLGHDIVVLHLRRGQVELIGGFDVRHLFEKVHQFREIEKLGEAGACPVAGALGNEFVKMIFVSFLNSNIYPLKNLPTSRVCIFLETPYSKASSHFPIASHLQ